jgi:hypothetical protein
MKRDEIAKHEERKAARRLARSEARKNIVNPFKVGDILYNSWGYEQTNIDWYQVVAVKGKTVTLRPIVGEVFEHDSAMSGWTKPKPSNWGGPPFRKTLQVHVDHNGTAYDPYLPMKHGCLSKWDGNKVHCSWYH